MKSIKKLLLVTIVAILLCSMAVATASATTDVKDEKKNSGIAIESKEKKVSSYKITWDYNGGKIGSKKSKVTTVKRGSKIGKLAATPKRSGYSFKGWYTKKSGGKKISKNTKPSKSVTYFAQWMTKGSTSTSSKIVGTWRYTSYRTGPWFYYFYADGKFRFFEMWEGQYLKHEGKYSVSNGKVYLKGIKIYSTSYGFDKFRESKFSEGNYRGPGKDLTSEYKLGSDNKGNYLDISPVYFDGGYKTFDSTKIFYKQ